jgi:endonuclease-3
MNPEFFSFLQQFRSYWWDSQREEEFKEVESDPFKLLVFTILSQNTSSENTWRAWRSLRSKYDVSAEVLAKANSEELAEVIRSGGLPRVKARRIIEASRYLIDNGVSLAKIIEKGEKKELLKIPGVGHKTADVLISSKHGQKEHLIVDTHMERVAKRLGLVDERAGYDEIQKALVKFLEHPDDETATLFWFFARHMCTARNPKCGECILRKDCKFRSGAIVD